MSHPEFLIVQKFGISFYTNSQIIDNQGVRAGIVFRLPGFKQRHSTFLCFDNLWLISMDAIPQRRWRNCIIKAITKAESSSSTKNSVGKLTVVNIIGAEFWFRSGYLLFQRVKVVLHAF